MLRIEYCHWWSAVMDRLVECNSRPPAASERRVPMLLVRSCERTCPSCAVPTADRRIRRAGARAQIKSKFDNLIVQRNRRLAESTGLYRREQVSQITPRVARYPPPDPVIRSRSAARLRGGQTRAWQGDSRPFGHQRRDADTGLGEYDNLPGRRRRVLALRTALGRTLQERGP